MDATIAVIGPGAIGPTVAAFLHAAGRRVILCGRTPSNHVEVRGDNQAPILVTGPIHTDPDAVSGPVDVVLFAVKDAQNASASAWLTRLCDPKTVECALQNGVEQADRLHAFCASATVRPAVVWSSAEVQPEGWVRLRTEARLVLPDTPAARPLADILTVEGMATHLDADFITAAWRKLFINALAVLTVLTGRRAGMFRRNDIGVMARRYLTERVAVARAEGAVRRQRHRRCDRRLHRRSRRSHDHDARRPAGKPPPRVRHRNGVISRLGRRHGIETPVSDVSVPLLATASDGPARSGMGFGAAGPNNDRCVGAQSTNSH